MSLSCHCSLYTLGILPYETEEFPGGKLTPPTTSQTTTEQHNNEESCSPTMASKSPSNTTEFAVEFDTNTPISMKHLVKTEKCQSIEPMPISHSKEIFHETGENKTRLLTSGHTTRSNGTNCLVSLVSLVA